MSTRYEWKQQYDLGIEDIDFQHHFFLNLINRLGEELERSDDLVYRAALFAELSAYARFHFLSEENMMIRDGFPGLDEHRRKHLQLLDQLALRGAAASTGRKAPEENEDLLEFLGTWFFNHTAGEDRLYAAFARSVANSG